MDKIKLFYAHTTHNDNIQTVHDKICEKLGDDKFEVLDIDNENNTNNVLDRMKSLIEISDLFICDITSDVCINENNKYSLVNSNVMLELGYAIAKSKEIIYLLNTEATNKTIPSFLEGMHYIDYNNSLSIDHIVDEINFKAENIPKDGWESVNYKIGTKLINMITNLIDIQYIEKIVVRINKKEKRIGILCIPTGKNTKCRWIDIKNKTFTLGKTCIDLTMFKDIDDELKHLELMANLVWLK